MRSSLREGPTEVNDSPALTDTNRSHSFRPMAGLTYRDAGVDIDAGERLVERIKPLAESTHSVNVLGSLGGFAGLYALPAEIEDPVLVSGTDGVGTKLRLAFELGKHETIGIDLVAMSVNDILTVGARPLFFLDYFATSKLDVGQAEAVIRGITEGCKAAGCALLGGETAELPGFYSVGEYDLAGFAVGVVGRESIVDGRKVNEGDRVIGLGSSGLHSNGYSLARRALLEGDQPLSLTESVVDGAPLGVALLQPTRVYSDAVATALEVGVHAMCHVTGGGLTGNLPRVLPEGLGARIDRGSWSTPAIFDLIRERGSVQESEMLRTFNMGIGFAFVVEPTLERPLVDALDRNHGQEAFVIGEVVEGDGVTFLDP